MKACSFALVSGLLCLAKLSVAGYVLQDDYTPSNFFSQFSFFTASDPTNGFVKYVDQGTAQSSGLIKNDGGSVYMGVDHTNIASSGRSSVRITSNKSYNHGLFILDVAHMPEGCGTWPAFWMTGTDWPNNGEIDILEGVNDQITNAMTLHTGPGCTITNTGLFSGTIATSDCNVNAVGQPTNAGCSIGTQNAQTYGPGLNAVGGGVYATEWVASGISIWFFPRGSVPGDITSGTPSPESWGRPIAHFAGGCNIDSIFRNQQIVFDTTFCGDWAGATWPTSSCASKASTCEAFVENNPAAFKNAYWDVNSLKVYSNSGSGSKASSNPPAVNPLHQPVPVPAPAPAPALQPATTTQDIQATFVFTQPIEPTGHVLTAMSWPVSDAQPEPTPLTALHWPINPQAAAVTAPSHSDDDGVLQSEFFGEGSEGIPDSWIGDKRGQPQASRRESGPAWADTAETWQRKHARHLLLHRKIRAHAAI